MSAASFFLGFAALSLAQGLLMLVLQHAMERRGGVLYPLPEALLGLVLGTILSLFAVWTSTNWHPLLRIVAGLLGGVPVGWALVMAAGFVQWLAGLMARKITTK